MKKKTIVCIFVLMLALFSLCSCGQPEEEIDDVTIDPNDLVLNVYNWGEYISDGSEDSYDTVAEFEKYYFDKYGKRIKVNYSTFATNEDMYNKIKSGAGNYDVITPSDYMIQKMADEGLLYPFDPKTTVENYGNIYDDYKGLYYDPDERYTVAYSYGKVGIIYNADMVDEEDVADQSWSLLWNPKYRSKILQFNNPRDGFATAMYYHGLDINSTNPNDWNSAMEYLLEQKPLVQGYVSDEIFNKMTGCNAAIGTYYAGDYITMSADNESLRFYYPKEGTNIFVDAMCIPKNAKHKALAIEYINFLISEEPAIANAEYIGYASPNRVVVASDTYAEDMGEEAMEILYSEDDVNENYPFDPFFHALPAEIQTLMNENWESMKTESAIEIWVHITSALIVGGVLGFGIFCAVRRRKRAMHYLKKAK